LLLLELLTTRKADAVTVAVAKLQHGKTDRTTTKPPLSAASANSVATAAAILVKKSPGIATAAAKSAILAAAAASAESPLLGIHAPAAAPVSRLILTGSGAHKDVWKSSWTGR